jgi:hypothetical protein
MAKLKLNTPFEKISAAKLKATKKKGVSPKNLVGTWVNCDRATRGLVKVIIGNRRGTLTVHAFGACHPTPCDWKKVKGLAYAENVSSSKAVAFSAFYKFSFKETIITGHLCGGCLFVETFNHFTDNSGRSDYYSGECFCRK